MQKNKLYLFILLLVLMILLVTNTKDDYQKIIHDDKNISDKESVGIVEIPKINLSKKFYNKDSINNDIDKNLMIIGDMPNQEGQFIIAGHSGTSPIAYFNDLDKLENGDEINVYYENNKYIYTIFEIYDINKTGKLYLKKNEKGIIVLITCRIGTNNQTIYKGIIKNN